MEYAISVSLMMLNMGCLLYSLDRREPDMLVFAGVVDAVAAFYAF